MKEQVTTPPSKIYLPDPNGVDPIELTFLCEYPYQTPGIYAVYLNGQSKQPERIYLPAIDSDVLSRDKTWQMMYSSAKRRLDMITAAMESEGVKFQL